MDESSDGKECDSIKKNETVFCNLRKTRHFSVGSVNLSKSEINKIIGISDKKSNREQTTSDGKKSRSVSEYQMQIPGEIKNDEVFKPKKLLSRTPPNKEQTMHEEENRTEELHEVFPQKKNTTETPPKSEKDEVIRSKRPRSGSSPSSFSERQKVAKHALNPGNKIKETVTTTAETEETTNTMIEKILIALEIINNFSERDKFEQNDLIGMRKASFELHKNVTKLVYKVGKLERENDGRKIQITGQGTREGDKANNIQRENTQNSIKTYSSVTKINTNQEKPTGETWKTPEKSRKYEILVKPKDSEKAINIVKEIKEKLKDIGSMETFKNIRHLQSGGIIIECYSDDQQKRIQDIVQTKENLHTKGLQNTDPMLMITGIDKGYDPGSFIQEFVHDNSQIMDVFGPNIKERMIFIAKKQCRNARKENWILQTTPDIFKWIIRNENLCFDLTKVYVQEYINLARCYNCCNFGHVAKYCKADPCCHKCGDKHEANKCPINTPLDCPNCKRLNLQERKHSARDQNCPAFLKKVQKQREYVNFSSENRREDFLLEV